MKVELAVALILAAPGCGARSALTLVEGESESDAGVDAGVLPPPRCDRAPVSSAIGPAWSITTRPRTGADAFFEPRWDRIAVYGGGPVVGSSYERAIIAIDLDPPNSRELEWTPRDLDGWNFGAVARDAENERVFLVGGWYRTSADGDRTFEISPSGPNEMTWRELPRHPMPLRDSVLAWEPEGRRLVLFGGYFRGGSDTRSWSMEPDVASATWKELRGAGGPQRGTEAAMVYVPGFGLVLLSSSEAPGSELGRLFLMRPGSERWEALPMDRAWGGYGGPLFFDPASCTLVWWGGGCETPPKTIRIANGRAYVEDVLVPPAALARVFQNVTIDPVGDEIVVHGGYDCDVATKFETALGYSLIR